MTDRSLDWFEQASRDLDVLLVVAGAKQPPMRRPIEWDLTALPVPSTWWS